MSRSGILEGIWSDLSEIEIRDVIISGGTPQTQPPFSTLSPQHQLLLCVLDLQCAESSVISFMSTAVIAAPQSGHHQSWLYHKLWPGTVTTLVLFNMLMP